MDSRTLPAASIASASRPARRSSLSCATIFAAGVVTSVSATLPLASAVDSAGLEKKRSEEHTSELQSLMRISYAVFCLKTKKKHDHKYNYDIRSTVTYEQYR